MTKRGRLENSNLYVNHSNNEEDLHIPSGTQNVFSLYGVSADTVLHREEVFISVREYLNLVDVIYTNLHNYSSGSRQNMHFRHF